MRLSQGRALQKAAGLCFAVVPGTAYAAQGSGYTPLLQITPSIAVRYDSNVARGNSEIARERGVHPSDWRFSPSLNVELQKPLGNQEVYLIGDIGYDFYARNKRLNRERILLDGGTHLRFSRCTGTVDGNLAIRQTDLAELIDAGRARNTEYVRTIGLSAHCGATIGLVAFGGVSRTWVSNSASDRKFSDSTVNQANAGIGYARPTLGELAVTASVRSADYPNRDVVGLSDHFHVFSIGARYTREVGARLQGSVALNRTTVDSGPGFPKFTGLTSAVNLSAVLSDALRAQVNWTRDVQPVNLGFGDFDIDSRLSLDADYAMSPRITLSGGGGLIHRHIEGEAFILVPELHSERRVFEYARLTYNRSARTSVALDVRHEQRSADPSSFNYQSTSAGLVFRMTF